MRFIRIAAIGLLLGAPTYLSAQDAPPDEDIREAKPMIVIPEPEKPPIALWLGIGGGLLALAGAWLLWKRRNRNIRLQSPPEVALASLRDLEATRDELAAEAFANRAAQTLRQYIAGRFGIVAPRRTTEEFLRDLARTDINALANESDHLRTFLKSCDLAKFAGTHLDPGQRSDLIQAARDFVTSTTAENRNSNPATP